MKCRNMIQVVMIVSCVVTWLSTVTSGVELSKEEKALLDGVRTAREITMGRFTSGRIVALVTEMEALDGAKQEVSLPEHRVEAVFLGNSSLVREWRADDENKQRRVVLQKDGRKVTYTPPGSEAPSSLHIEAAGRGVIFHPPLIRWTLHEIATVNMGSPDSVFWSAVFERYPHVKVEKDASIVRLTLEYSSEEHNILHGSRVIEFDMSKGGMICRWSRDRLERREGEDFRMEESGQMAWELEGGVIVPVHRTTNLVGTKGGKRFYEHHGNVKFLSVSDEEVGPEELSVHRMGVVVGTPVVDQVMGLEYRYSQQGKFGDARQELPADLLANGNSVKAASGQHEPQEGDAGEHPTRVEPEDDGQTHQPKRPSTSMLYAIGLGLFLAILLGGYFAIRRLKRGT